MNLSEILKEENPTVRQVLYENWKQDEAWKGKLEQRVRGLEQQKQPKNESNMLKKLEFKSNPMHFGINGDNSA